MDDRRHGAYTFVPPDPSTYAEPDRVAREAIYAGAYYDVYGHFLLECLQRLWWAMEHPDLPIVWMAPLGADEDGPLQLSGWQRDMLDVVGITNEILILARPTRFEVLHVPDAGYKYADWSHPRQIDFLAAYDGPPQEDGLRLWLSRDGSTGVGVINRHIIERQLAARGWTIVTPELMPLRDQLDALARAEVVAGEEGSTFHTLLLLRDVSRKRFHVFRRHGPEHISFHTIGDARQVDQQIHSCSHDAVISVEGRAVVRLAPNPAQYLSHLGVRIARPRVQPPDWKPSATIRRVNALGGVLGAQRLLQLGWRGHAAFTRITVPHRDIVADEFTFDVRSYRDQGAWFYEVSLEQFLERFASGEPYDVVLLENPHDWRQALDLIRTTLASAAHDGTVVLLDNVMPADGSEEHGDVFKAVLAIHDLHPELTYRTITTGGRAQAVIWREPRVVRPRFEDEDRIDALTWAEAERDLDAFAPVAEESALADVRAWTRRHGRAVPASGSLPQWLGRLWGRLRG